MFRYILLSLFALLLLTACRGNEDTSINPAIDRTELEQLLDDNTKAIQLLPNSAFAYFNREVSYRALGQNQLADADKTMACSLDTQYC
jgi:hypothetical protein